MNTRAITAVSSVIASDKLTKEMHSRNHNSPLSLTVSLSLCLSFSLPLRFSGSFTAYRLVNRLGCIRNSSNYEMSMQRHEKRRDMDREYIVECVLMPLLFMTDFWLLYFWHLKKIIIITPSISIRSYIDMYTHKHTRGLRCVFCLFIWSV